MVLEGAFDFFDGQDWTPFKQGEVRCSLRGQYHGFCNTGATAGKMMFVTNAGGLDEYFALISPLDLPRDFDRLTEISKYYGYVFLPLETIKMSGVLAPPRTTSVNWLDDASSEAILMASVVVTCFGMLLC